jgi:hypothetical protein
VAIVRPVTRRSDPSHHHPEEGVMTGKLNEPGTLSIEWLDPVAEPVAHSVSSGPWTYADWLCFKPADDARKTKYVPLRNVAAWSKEVSP